MEENNIQTNNNVTMEDLARMISQGFTEAKEDRDEILNKLGGQDQKIDGVETRLNQKIDNVEAGLNQKIDGVETRLNQKIDNVEAGLNQKIDGVEIELVEVKNVVKRISEDTDALVKNFCDLDIRTARLKKSRLMPWNWRL